MQILCVATVFMCLSHTIGSGLQGIGDVITPSIGVFVGAVIKTVINSALIPIYEINIYGAAISSVICQIIMFLIVYITLYKKIGAKIDLKKNRKNIFSISSNGGNSISCTLYNSKISKKFCSGDTCYNIRNDIIYSICNTIWCNNRRRIKRASERWKTITNIFKS